MKSGRWNPVSPLTQYPIPIFWPRLTKVLLAPSAVFGLTQDFEVPLTRIHSAWQRGKISTVNAKAEILRSRGIGAEKMLKVIEFHEKQARELEAKRISNCVMSKLKSKEKKFRKHATVDKWRGQYKNIYTDPDYRYLCLLLRGESQAGKTAYGQSLFGWECTLVVNCQGCSPDLPSIEAFDNQVHSAILWDEIDEQQVLHNKKVFQAPAEPVTLGQSKCNQFAYSKLLHGVAMILCSNTFDYPSGEATNSKLNAMDRDWILRNIYEVQLNADDVWYEETAEEREKRLNSRRLHVVGQSKTP